MLGQKPLEKAGNTSTLPAHRQAQTGQKELAVVQVTKIAHGLFFASVQQQRPEQILIRRIE